MTVGIFVIADKSSGWPPGACVNPSNGLSARYEEAVPVVPPNWQFCAIVRSAVKEPDEISWFAGAAKCRQALVGGKPGFHLLALSRDDFSW